MKRNLRKNSLLNRKIALFVALTVLSGCGLPLSIPFIKDKWKSTEHGKRIKAEEKIKAEKLKNIKPSPTGKEYRETIQQLPLLIKGGINHY